MTATATRLSFGYNDGLPEGTTTAWGCRAIVTQTGSVDIVWDRTDCIGEDADRAALLAYLNETVGTQWIEEARRLLRAYEMSTREAREFILYDDGDAVVIGNTNGSAGYLYVCAYRREAS